MSRIALYYATCKGDVIAFGDDFDSLCQEVYSRCDGLEDARRTWCSWRGVLDELEFWLVTERGNTESKTFEWGEWLDDVEREYLSELYANEYAHGRMTESEIREVPRLAELDVNIERDIITYGKEFKRAASYEERRKE